VKENGEWWIVDGGWIEDRGWGLGAGDWEKEEEEKDKDTNTRRRVMRERNDLREIMVAPGKEKI